ncbi:hypothetical protein LINPERPRIM_LOCUS14504 [Linum perenne]
MTFPILLVSPHLRLVDPPTTSLFSVVADDCSDLKSSATTLQILNREYSSVG